MTNATLTALRNLADAMLREKGTRLLDETLAYDGRGPRTFQARARVAESLDKGRKPYVADLRWLEHVADEERKELHS